MGSCSQNLRLIRRLLTRALAASGPQAVGLSLPWLDNFGRGAEEPQIVLLDVGMATGLPEEDKDKMLNLFLSCTNMDGYAMALATLSFSEKQACDNPEEFCRDVQAKVKTFKDWENSGVDCSSDALLSLLELIRLHKVGHGLSLEFSVAASINTSSCRIQGGGQQHIVLRGISP